MSRHARPKQFCRSTHTKFVIHIHQQRASNPIRFHILPCFAFNQQDQLQHNLRFYLLGESISESIVRIRTSPDELGYYSPHKIIELHILLQRELFARCSRRMDIFKQIMTSIESTFAWTFSFFRKRCYLQSPATQSDKKVGGRKRERVSASENKFVLMHVSNR